MTTSTPKPPMPTTSIPITDLTTTIATPSPASTSTHTLPPPFDDTNPPPTLLTQGAEALVYKTNFLDPSTPAALKYRPSKPYRHPTLDARLTKARVLAEARVLVRLAGLKGEGVNVPAVLGVEWDVARKVKGLGEGVERVRGGGAWLLMEWVEGRSVKELLRAWDVWVKENGGGGEERVRALLRRVGRAVACMHAKAGVIHGDLTSSNIMVRSGSGELNGDGQGPPSTEGEIVLIDFGLATQSVQEEDRAVDLYVLERAFGSTHPRQEGWFDEEVLQSQEGYRGAFKGASSILKRLEEVRMRGRKRTMIG